jgi:ferrous iron transport protein B
MHGYGIVAIFLGMGCNVSGMLATRSLETRKQRFIASTLLAISVPCMGQTAMIFGILGPYGIVYIGIVFVVLLLTFIIVGSLLNRLVPGRSPEIFLDIPPYRRPSGRALAKKTLMRIRWFLKDAIPWLFFGVLVVNLLYALGFLQIVGDLFAPLTEGWLGLPRNATTALMIGFLRKDLAVGMLLPLNMGPMQLVISATLLTVYFPCVATFVVMFKELGARDLLKSLVIMIVVALAIGGVMRLVLLGW